MKDWKLLMLVLILMFVAFYVFFGTLIAYGVVVLMAYEYKSCYYSHDFEFSFEDAAHTYTVKIDDHIVRQYNHVYVDKFVNGKEQ